MKNLQLINKILTIIYSIVKVIPDTLMIRGKFAHKRIAAFSIFIFLVYYTTLPQRDPNFQVQDFVVMWFSVTMCACLGFDMKQRLNEYTSSGEYSDLTNKEDKL